LTREAWDVKRQISANVERERVIIDELEKLGSRWVPEGTTVDSGSSRKRKREDERVEGGDDVRDALRDLKDCEDQLGTFLGLLCGFITYIF
jgi:sugar phosphate isomerase/epimerase